MTAPAEPQCRRGRHCADSATDDTTGDRVGAHPTASGLCPACERAAGWSVHDMPARVAELDELLTDTMRARSSKRPQGMPGQTYREGYCELDLDADKVARHIEHELTAWAEAVDDALEQADPDRTLAGRWETTARRVPIRVQAAATFLRAHWTAALALGVDEYATHGDRPLAVDTLDEWRVSDAGIVWTSRDGASRACAVLALDWQALELADRGPDRDTLYPDVYCPHCGSLGTVRRRTPAVVGAAAPLRCVACQHGVPESVCDAWGALDSITVEYADDPMASARANILRAGATA